MKENFHYLKIILLNIFFINSIFCSYVDEKKLKQELNSEFKRAFVVYLQPNDGPAIPVPYQYFNDDFKQKIDLLIKTKCHEKLVIDCTIFSESILKLIREILIFDAGNKFIKQNATFPITKIENLLQNNNQEPKNIVIGKSQNLLRALKFFQVSDSHFEPILKECKRITGCKKKELIYFQEDLLDALESKNLASLESEQSEFEKHEMENYQDLNFTESIMYGQLHLSPENKRSIAFSLVQKKAQEDPYVALVQPYVIDSDSWKKLELLCGPDSAENIYFAASVDQTYSQVSKVILYSKLLQPTDNPQLVKQNKEIISVFLENPEVFKQVDGSLSKFFKNSEWENGMLSFFNERKDYFKHSLERYTFNELLPDDMLRWLNSNELSSSVFNVKDKITLWVTDKITKPTDKLHEYFPALGGMTEQFQKISCVIPMGSLYKYSPLRLGLKLADAITLNYCGVLPAAVQAILSNELANVFSDFFICLHDKNHRQEIQGRMDVIGCLYEKLFILAQYVKVINEVSTELKKIPGLQEKLPFLKNLDLERKANISTLNYLLNEMKNPDDFDQFINKLESDIFSEKDKAWAKTRFGRIISTYYLISIHKKKLFDIFMALSELDYYLSLVRLYNKHKDSSNKYCFVEPVESYEPVIELEDFWNPTLGQKAVSNILTLGGDQPKDAIITGENEGGKSTYLRNIVFCLLMAPTGLCPANKAKLTLPSNIRAYLNITDDAAHDKSLFRSSTERANELIKVAGKSYTKGPSITVFDEFFNATKPLTGESLGYGTLKNLNDRSKYPRNICIAVTHYSCVQKLHEEPENRFKFLMVAPKSDTQNRYKAIPGIYTDFNGLSVAQDVKIPSEVITYASAYFEENLKEIPLNGYKLYLDMLRDNKESFEKFIDKLYLKDPKVIQFFFTISLTAPYCYEFFKIAIEHEFDVKELINFQDTLGRTLLHHMALKDIKDIKLLSFLLLNGADRQLEDIMHRKPIDYALASMIKDRLSNSNS